MFDARKPASPERGIGLEVATSKSWHEGANLIHDIRGHVTEKDKLVGQWGAQIVPAAEHTKARCKHP